LGVREAGTDGFETLSAYLHDKRLLLVLDNFEHLLTAAPLVANLLKAAPQVRALVSSREILHLSIEHEFPVPALELLDVQHLPTTQSLLSYSRNASVSLFKERACAAQPDFHLTPENVADVARICAWLDGLPLAIEIAAAQIKSNTPEQLFAQLRDRLGGLTSGPRDLSPRQQSLHGAIDWSWNLLTKPEQRLFRRLSAFFGGWTLESAQAVCGGEIAGLNAALVNKSLVVVDQTARGGTRHHFHEMVRQYANEKLVEAGEDESIRTRHLKYNFELIDRAEPGLAGPQQQEWLDRLDDERDNLRGALAWSLASGAFREGLQAVCQSWMLWVLRGMISEGNQWCTSILAAYPGMDALRLRGLQLGIVFARQRGDAPQKRAYLDEARALAKTIGLPHALSHDLREEALYEHDQGDVSKAIELLDEALSHFRQMEDEPGLSETLFWLAEIWMHLDELETSRPLWEEGIAYMRRRGDAFYLGWGLGGLAEQAQREGKFAEATSLCRESMSLKWKSQDKGGIAFSWETFAMIATSQGRCERAVVLWGASARYREMIQSVLSPAKRAEKEHYIDQTRAGVGRHDFEELWQRGRTMSTEQILEFALSD